MANTGVISDKPPETAAKQGTVDLVVGIPTYNDAETIGPLLKTAQAALAQFSTYRCVVLQADGGSTDGTVEIAKSAAGDDGLVQISYPLYPIHKLAISYSALPGRESAYRSILSAAQDMGSKACCLVDPDAQSLTSDWISLLVHPIVELDFDFIAPQYHRHKYDGLMITGILYPVVRALFGKRVRQPVGKDFGLSAALIRRCLATGDWNTETVRRHVDLWLSLQAMQGDMKVCQVYLGSRAKSKKEASPDLSTVLSDAVGTLFDEMEKTAEVWQRIRGSRPVSSFGLRFDMDADPITVDVKPMIESYRLGCQSLQDIWAAAMPPATVLELRRMCRLTDDNFCFPNELWARTIYDFAVGYRLRAIGRDHLLRALTPLYLGWMSSFILSVGESTPAEVEDRIETLCRAFESQKPYLISRWRWPDRFMP
jgi:hypothetical protein